MFTALSLMSAVGSRYASAASYRDSGTLNSAKRYTGGKQFEITNLSFETQFQKPDFYSFGWTLSPFGYYRVWCDGHSAFICTPTSGVKKQNDLDHAIGAATGISGGSIYWISSLLIDSFSGKTLSQLSSAILTESPDKTNDRYRIVADWNKHHDIELVIDADFTIRRITEKTIITAEETRRECEEFEARLKARGRPFPPDKPPLEDSETVHEFTYNSVSFNETIDASAFH